MAKNISLNPSGKSLLGLSPSRPVEGRWPSSRTLGGMQWTLWLSQDERCLRRTAKPCGPDAPTLASSFAGSDSCEATVAKEPGHRGERVISRKPLRREGRSVSANLWRLRSCAFFLHARLRVRRAPGFPCALYLSRDKVVARLGRTAPREGGCSRSRHCEERERRSNPSFFARRNGLLRRLAPRNDELNWLFDN